MERNAGKARGLFTVAKLLFLEKLFLCAFILNYQAAIYKANINKKY